MRDYTCCRVASTLLGLTCAGLGSYGAFEFAYKLEGTVSYLVIAAPVVAVTAALIPPMAEATWRAGGYVKALLWWAVLIPASAVVFFSAAERVHDAKAGAEAERGALRGAAARASAGLTTAEAELAAARAAANKARGQKQCGPECRTKLAAEVSAQADVDAARLAMLHAERKATTESPLKAPVWLLPAALDAAPSWRSGRDSRVGRAGSLAANLPRGGGAVWGAVDAGHRCRRGVVWRTTTTSSLSMPRRGNLRARPPGGLSACPVGEFHSRVPPSGLFN